MIAKLFFVAVLIALFALVICTCTACTSTCIVTPDGYEISRTSFGQEIHAKIKFGNMGNPESIEYGSDGGKQTAKEIADVVTESVIKALGKGLVK